MFVYPDVRDHQILLYTRLIIVALGVLGYVAGHSFPTSLAMVRFAPPYPFGRGTSGCGSLCSCLT